MTLSGSKWHLAPDFTSAALSENDSIASAIELVLRAKHKRLSDAQKRALVHNVESFANGSTIRHLNRLSNEQWDALDCIPLLCKVY